MAIITTPASEAAGILRCHRDPSSIIYAVCVFVGGVAREAAFAVECKRGATRTRRFLRKTARPEQPKPHGPVTEFEHARQWAKENSIDFYERWSIGYGWADTVQGDRDDEDELVRHWRANH